MFVVAPLSCLKQDLEKALQYSLEYLSFITIVNIGKEQKRYRNSNL